MNWQEDYHQRQPLFERLKAELEFSLQQEVDRSDIKVHSITGRVKTVASIEDKCRRKGYTDPLRQAPDIVGVRVIALFLTDLPELSSVVRHLFDVSSYEDKVEGGGDPSAFGYMSHHYEATIKEEHAGPWYDELRSMHFEVQVRTMLMDAWANVSHYLAYKGESSVPEELRRDFHALSGLFYIADKHFELFFADAGAVQRDAGERTAAENTADIELNLDTLAGFLQQRFPGRRRSDREAIAILADDLLLFGVTELKGVERILTEAADTFKKHELDQPPKNKDGKFADVGVVRVSFALINPEFEAYRSLSDSERAKRRAAVKGEKG